MTFVPFYFLVFYPKDEWFGVRAVRGTPSDLRSGRDEGYTTRTVSVYQPAYITVYLSDGKSGGYRDRRHKRVAADKTKQDHKRVGKSRKVNGLRN